MWIRRALPDVTPKRSTIATLSCLDILDSVAPVDVGRFIGTVRPKPGVGKEV
jgi:hypothetical protein